MLQYPHPSLFTQLEGLTSNLWFSLILLYTYFYYVYWYLFLYIMVYFFVIWLSILSLTLCVRPIVALSKHTNSRNHKNLLSSFDYVDGTSSQIVHLLISNSRINYNDMCSKRSLYQLDLHLPIHCHLIIFIAKVKYF